MDESSSKKSKKAAAGKRKAREEEDEISEESPKKRGGAVDLGRPALRNGQAEEEDEEDSSAPAKKGRKVVKKPKVPAKKEKTNGSAQAEQLGRKLRDGKQAEKIEEENSEEDMFATSPSPVKKAANREFKEMGSQVNLSWQISSFNMLCLSGESSICGSRKGGQEERQSGGGWKEERGFGCDPDPCNVGADG